ncbi:MAG TPA: phosphotransferase [Acidimicrobiia bacterium]|nr:phosphotransferase [Acidimicrobiia bacterium]
MTETGPLLASGRDGDIFEFGPGRVLRRAKSGRVIEGEARIIAYAREHGYPVPEIYDVLSGGTEIVMERIEGPMMADEIMHAPWKMARHCRELANLHDRLHVIPAPDWLPDMGGDRLVHLDLHPLNVMMTASGPVVIDWTNAGRGDPLLDVGFTYILLTCPRVPGSNLLNLALRPVRFAMGRAFTKRYRGRELDAQLVQAAGLKALDSNMSADEVAAIERAGARAKARVSR